MEFAQSAQIVPIDDGPPRHRMPPWLKKRVPDPASLNRMRRLLRGHNLHTICESGGCPNIGECWANNNATFMILGEVCTRGCGFCKVMTGMPPLGPRADEPGRLADAVAELGLEHVVITAVARDDLADGGSGQFAACIRHIHEKSPGTTIEVLIPDFKGDADSLGNVLAAEPDILAHNVETVAHLQGRVRPQAKYERSLGLLQTSKEMAPHILTKTGFMLGLGEERSEVIELMRDLRHVDCDLLTVGQYLRPSDEHLPVEAYVAPDVFDEYRQIGEELGFLHVASAPFVRSSYNAGRTLREVRKRKEAM